MATMTTLTVTQVGTNYSPASWRCCLADAPDFSATGATIAEAVGALACKYPLALGLEVDLRPWPSREGEKPPSLMPPWEVVAHAQAVMRANGHVDEGP